MDGDERQAADEAAPKSARDAPPRAAARASVRATLSKWAFAAVPAIGLLELGAHVVQAHSTIDEADWKSAREYVAAASKPDDLVTLDRKSVV